jgi:peptide/nickel transport system substrate-binding protein
LTPWKTVQPINTPTWVLERNPYYWAVDPEGNQLPYLDQIVMTLAENLEVLNLRAIAGEYDEQERHTNIALIPAFIENQERGDYTLRADPSNHGADTIFQINLGYDKDPEMSKWLKNADFRRALSLGVDRDQINETFYLGLGVPGSPVVAEASPENPGPEWRTKWHTHDPDQANQMLDDLGLGEKDEEGFRLRTDGEGRVRVEIMTVGAAFLPWTQHSEMVAQQWRKIGIFGDVQEVERGLMTQRVNAGEHMIRVWMNDGSDNLFLYPAHALPVAYDSVYGPEYGMWYASNGEEGKEPEDENMFKVLELFRSGSGKSAEERIKIVQEIWKILVDDVWAIGIVGQAPGAMGVRVVKNDMGNIPDRQMNAQHCRTPGTSHPATFFWKK